MPLLKVGDTVGLIASANPLTKDLNNSLEKAHNFFKKVGIRIEMGKNCFQNIERQNFMVNAKLRSEDFNAFVKQSNIKAIINLWGGYNSNDILEYIDWNNLKRNPKLIIGASDFTSILNGAFKMGNLVTYHWINALWLGLNVYEESEITFKTYFFEMPSSDILTLKKAKVMRNGLGKGYLFGGNLETFERLIATAYFPKKEGYILFFEQSSMSIFQILSIIKHLDLANIWKGCKGLVLGHFKPVNTEKNLDIAELISSTLMNNYSKYKFPIIQHINIGHDIGNEVMPVGRIVTINTTKPNYLFT